MSHMCGKKRWLAVAAVLAIAWGAAGAEDLSPNAWNYINATGAPMVPGAERGYNSITGEMFADVMQASVTVQREFARALPSIADYCQTAHVQNPDGMNNSYCAPNSKWVMWDTPWYMKDTKKRDDGSLGYQNYSGGFATGISRLLGESTAIGLAVGYDDRKLTGRDDYHWREKADAFHAALYGGTAIGCFFVDAYAGYSHAWQRAERTVEFGNLDTNKANYSDTVLSAGVKASYVWVLPNEMRITPAIGLDYSYARQGALTEYGWDSLGNASGTALRVDKAHHHSLLMPITVSVNRTFTSNFLTFGGKCSLWTPEVRAGWIPQFGSKRTGVDYRLASAPSTSPAVSARSNKLGSSYGTAGAGLKIKLSDKYIFAIDYDYTFSGKYNNHSITGTYGVSF